MLYLLNEHGYLPAGFHRMSIDELKTIFVDRFPDSSTRMNIFQGYLDFCNTLQSLGVINFYQWIDGSFCTSKLNPNDIDVVTFIDYYLLNSLNDQQKSALMQMKSRDDMKHLFSCDSFIMLVPPAGDPAETQYINNRMYWRGVWGFDRLDNPKGTVQISFGGGARDAG